MSEQDHGGIKVTDKRRFTEEGESRESNDQVSATADKKAETEVKAEDKVEAEPKVEKKPKGEKHELPPIDFVTFILSLASSVQVHMGLIPNPGTGKPEKNLNLAKQTIDILGVLQEKTKGNLEEGEDKLLEGILYDLRMKYVELNK